MRIIGARAAAAALPFDRLIESLRALSASGCEVPARHVHQPAPGMTWLIMPAWMPGGPYAVKIVIIAQGNGALGLPGRPLALIDDAHHAQRLRRDARRGRQEPLAHPGAASSSRRRGAGRP
jgi:hypothetical protein